MASVAPAMVNVGSSMATYPILETNELLLYRTDAPAGQEKETAFSNRYELAIFNLFRSYGMRCSYEPRTFPLEWHYNKKGKKVVTEAFTPDIYLEDLQMYVELTVRHDLNDKNRKIRKFRQKYPKIKIHLWTEHDIEDFFFSKDPGALMELREYIRQIRPSLQQEKVA